MGKKYPTKQDMLDERYGKVYRRLQHQMEQIKEDYGSNTGPLFDVKEFIKLALAMDDILYESLETGGIK